MGCWTVVAVDTPAVGFVAELGTDFDIAQELVLHNW